MDPFKATGKPHTLWVAFAKFYEDNGQLDDVSAFVSACCVVCVQRCPCSEDPGAVGGWVSPDLCLP